MKEEMRKRLQAFYSAFKEMDEEYQQRALIMIQCEFPELYAACAGWPPDKKAERSIWP